MLNMLQQFKRLKKQPLDSTEILSSSKIAYYYAINGPSYDGQRIYVKNKGDTYQYEYKAIIKNNMTIIDEDAFEHIIEMKEFIENGTQKYHFGVLIYQNRYKEWNKKDIVCINELDKYSLIAMSDLFLNKNNKLHLLLEYVVDGDPVVKRLDWEQNSIFNPDQENGTYIKLNPNPESGDSLILDNINIPKINIMPKTNELARNSYNMKIWAINDDYCKTIINVE